MPHEFGGHGRNPRAVVGLQGEQIDAQCRKIGVR
jgi:hypothetical protein